MPNRSTVLTIHSLADELRRDILAAGEAAPGMAVLRDGTPSQDPRYPQDDDPDAIHLGIFDDGSLIATSTWLDRPWPHDESHFSVQLRGMAVAKTHQSRGIGGVLLQAGIDRAGERGARYVWARARDLALRFYEQHGFDVVGDQFIDGSHSGCG